MKNQDLDKKDLNKLDKEVETFFKFYQENYKTLELACEYYKSLLNSLISDEFEIQNITARIKDRNECISKFKNKYLEKLEEEGKEYNIKNFITDLIGLRIVCLYENDIPKIRAILEDNFKIVDVTDKIKSLDDTEDKFGYKSLHLDLKLNDIRSKLPEYKRFADLGFEVQIRTVIQDAWSVLDHKIKYKKTIPSELKRRINRLAALFELADDEFYQVKQNTKEFEDSSENKPNNSLNVTSAFSVMDQKFPTYTFMSYKIDGFVHEILNLNPKITNKEFGDSINQHLDTVKRYNSELVAKSVTNYLNPYTMVRHCLYMSDDKKYERLLFRIQGTAFDFWLAEQRDKKI